MMWLEELQPGTVVPVDEVRKELGMMARLMGEMAEQMRATNERMTGLEREIRRLTKVTPSQAAEINRLIRERAAAVCVSRRAAGCEKAVAALIRKSVKIAAGVTRIAEVARCDFEVVRDLVEEWDDFRAVLEVKRRCGK